jgi:hypothetical protein
MNHKIAYLRPSTPRTAYEVADDGTGPRIVAWSSPDSAPTAAELAALDTDPAYIDWRLTEARTYRHREMSDALNAGLMTAIPEAVRWHVIAATLARIVRDVGVTSTDPETLAMYTALADSADLFGVTPSEAQQVVAAQVAARNRHVAAMAAIDAIIAGEGTLAEKLTAIEGVTP